ncbi:MAG: hypothetical protein KJ600_00225 [Nanoarchaeota archaeon]|nr:hypothetical protein [Nanoarchaeota archaeon]MBU1102971.1 hypothetical protein [Nanoarchaeota archaeon]
MDEDKYGDIVRRMNRAVEMPVKVGRGWRDYLTRQRVGLVVCLSGLIVAAFSGRNFVNGCTNVLEDFGQDLADARQIAERFGDYESLGRTAERITANLESDALWSIGGIAAAGFGYAVARLRAREQWSPKIRKYEKVDRKQHKTL